MQREFRDAGVGDWCLLKVYAHCIDGQADAVNQRITDALSARDAQPEPGGEVDGDSEKASWAGSRVASGGGGDCCRSRAADGSAPGRRPGRCWAVAASEAAHFSN
jgi:hypothetical protein